MWIGTIKHRQSCHAFRGDQNMKKSLIIIINVVIMAAILIFVVLYSGAESKASYQRQIEHFEDSTVTMEQVTENYLESEQKICDIWARYINNNTMTMEEAAAYIRSLHMSDDTSAHLVTGSDRTYG